MASPTNNKKPNMIKSKEKKTIKKKINNINTPRTDIKKTVTKNIKPNSTLVKYFFNYII